MILLQQKIETDRDTGFDEIREYLLLFAFAKLVTQGLQGHKYIEFPMVNY